MIDFAAYRAAYDSMTYSELVEWHSRVWSIFPDQDKHSSDHLDRFFAKYSATRVLEVGGWKGEAAARLLAEHPTIESWHNYEICREAAYSPATDDPRYVGVWPPDWTWCVEPPRVDTAVLAHVIEHMRSNQLRKLIGWLSVAGVTKAYVEAPIWDKPRSWRRSSSFHVLEVGWDEVIPMWERHGFRVVERDSYPPDRRIVVFAK